MSTFGERVTAARKYLKLRQRELAHRVGITPGAINKIESGESKRGQSRIPWRPWRAHSGSAWSGWLPARRDISWNRGVGYASGQANRLLAAWEGLPLNLRVPLLALMEAMAGIERPATELDTHHFNSKPESSL